MQPVLKQSWALWGLADVSTDNASTLLATLALASFISLASCVCYENRPWPYILSHFPLINHNHLATEFAIIFWHLLVKMFNKDIKVEKETKAESVPLSHACWAYTSKHSSGGAVGWGGVLEPTCRLTLNHVSWRLVEQSSVNGALETLRIEEMYVEKWWEAAGLQELLLPFLGSVWSPPFVFVDSPSSWPLAETAKKLSKIQGQGESWTFQRGRKAAKVKPHKKYILLLIDKGNRWPNCNQGSERYPWNFFPLKNYDVNFLC